MHNIQLFYNLYMSIDFFVLTILVERDGDINMLLATIKRST